MLEGLLAGLAAAEQHGIVHRDLKPENLMVTSDGRVKIADFGIAKATTRMQTGAFLTATGTTVGTPTYMAPEQAMAQEVGPWTDLYSVGCMAYELFTGRVPFHDSEAPMAILLRHVNEPIARGARTVADVDPEISDWIDRLLVKDPTARTQSADEAWEDLEEIIIGLLGPRWRREARGWSSPPARPGPALRTATPKPLTPAPFEGAPDGAASGEPSDEFQSFAWEGAVPPPPTPTRRRPDRRRRRPGRPCRRCPSPWSDRRPRCPVRPCRRRRPRHRRGRPRRPWRQRSRRRSPTCRHRSRCRHRARGGADDSGFRTFVPPGAGAPPAEVAEPRRCRRRPRRRPTWRRRRPPPVDVSSAAPPPPPPIDFASAAPPPPPAPPAEVAPPVEVASAAAAAAAPAARRRRAAARPARRRRGARIGPDRPPGGGRAAVGRGAARARVLRRAQGTAGRSRRGHRAGRGRVPRGRLGR